MESLYAHALKLLVTRPHSRYELRTKLIRVCQRRKTTKLIRVRTVYQPLHCPTLTEEILQRLDDQTLLNDKEFAKYWREQREQYRPRSMYQLQGELRSKGIASDIMNEVLANYTELPAALRVANKKRHEKSTEIIRYLLGKGFQYTTAQHVVRKFEEDAQDSILAVPDPSIEEESEEEDDDEKEDSDE